MVRNRNHEIGLRAEQSQPLLRPQRFTECRSELFASGSFGLEAHFSQLILVHAEPNHRLETEAIPPTQKAAGRGIEKGPDRGRAAATPIRRRADCRVATARAQPWKQLRQVRKGKLATASGTTRRSSNGKDCRQ